MKLPRWQRIWRGFTLLELSISIAVIGIMLGSTAVVLSDKIDGSQVEESKERIDEITEALIAYKVRNGNLPCPASLTTVPGNAAFGREVNSGDCTYTSAPAGTSRIETTGGSGIFMLRGAVPVYDLLLPPSYAADMYGNLYTYSVMQPLTEEGTFDDGAAAIVVKNAGGTDIITDGAFVVVSHGKEGEGAYRLLSGAQTVACGATNLDIENCDADVTFIDTLPSDDQAQGANYFSDLVRWKSKPSLIIPNVLESPPPSPPDFTGVRIDGAVASGRVGTGVSVGDINGDGYADVVMGAPYANSNAGYTYVVFGNSTGISTPLDLTTIDGTNGFRLDGTTSGNYSGLSVSTGNINNDGYDDVIIAAPLANGNAGYIYVVFGKASGWAATTALSSLDGTTGFRLDASANDWAGYGYGLSSGDINNDGYDDVIIGAHNANTAAGYTYVVFGKAGSWAATTALSSLDGTTGFRLDGIASSAAGHAVSSDDINNDGFDDVIVGAYTANSSAGYTYVVFGKANGWAATTALSSLNGTTGFRLDGIASSTAGYAVSSGDVNGDGFDDVIVGAKGATTATGYIYVVFGKANGWAATVALSGLNGTTGFRLDGAGTNYYTGVAVSSGDVNGDGFNDVIAGATGASANGAAGYTYVVFGKASGWAATVALSGLNGITGFRLDGVAGNDQAGVALSAGDITGDTKDDIIIGAPMTDYNSRANSGSVYGIYGSCRSWSATNNLDTLVGTAYDAGTCPITPVTYTISSDCCAYTGQNDETKMRDLDYSSSNSIIGTSLVGTEWVKADFGSTKNVVGIHLAPVPAAAGWGVGYLNGYAIECSTDDSNWSNITTASGHVENETKTYSVAASCRYIRVTGNNYIVIGDFWFEE